MLLLESVKYSTVFASELPTAVMLRIAPPAPVSTTLVASTLPVDSISISSLVLPFATITFPFGSVVRAYRPLRGAPESKIFALFACGPLNVLPVGTNLHGTRSEVVVVYLCERIQDVARSVYDVQT